MHNGRGHGALRPDALRTSDEIANWEEYSDEQRAEVMLEITRREAEQDR